MISEAQAISASTPGPDYPITKLETFKKRSMSNKFGTVKSLRTDAIRKEHSTDYFETREAHKKSTHRAPTTVFSKGKKISFAEEYAKRHKAPGAGEYKTEKAYAMISTSPVGMKRRC